MDQRGHGDSDKPLNDYHWQRFADDLVAFVEALELNDVLGVGHSARGAAIILAASYRPDLISRAVLVESAIPSLGSLGGRKVSQRMAYRARRRSSSFPSTDAFFDYFRSKHRFRLWTYEALWLYAIYGTQMGLDGQVYLKCPPDIEASIIENNGSVDAWAALSKMKWPTLLMTSDAWATDVIEDVRDAMSDFTHIEIAETTHFLPVERSTALVTAILDFAWGHQKT